MDLSGSWRAASADDELRRAFTDPSFDDSAWEALAVPGHWRSSPAFSAEDGPVLHRRRFEAGAPSPGERRWLCLDGLFYQGDVWLDGTYVGDTEGYFVTHSFEITGLMADRAEHALAVEVTCAPQTDRAAKRNLTGVFQHWDCLGEDWNPGGIWRPVRVESSGAVRMRELKVLCREASADRAVLACSALLDADETRPVVVTTRVGATDHELERTLAAGVNRLEWAVTLDTPRLWWPWALGDQPLYDVDVAVWLGERAGDPDAGDQPSDQRRLRTGLRQVTMRDWVASVNGERLFLKGVNHGPTRPDLGNATAAEVAGDVTVARDAGLDLLRVHAHVSRPELYDAADEAGLLLWQDMPLQWGYARGVRPQAVLQARALVTQLGHHPSIALWCGHNEPMAIDVGPGALLDRRATARVARKVLVAQQLPTWNRSLLDRSVKRALGRSDGTRPVIAHSGVLPHLPQLDGTDSHLYFGWYHGEERDLPRALATMPRLARFVSEFGAEAVPTDAGFCQPERWPDLDWEHLGRHHCLQKRFFDRYVPPADHDTFAEWRDATQRYQATLIKHHVETLRRLKYRPTGGFAHFFLADAIPAVTWSVLDHQRRPKLGFRALTEACAPVIVVADRLPRSVEPGDVLALDVHVVSDLRHPLGRATCEAALAWPGGWHVWRWTGDIAADACVRVGTMQIVVPEPEAAGELRLDLTLTGPVKATNSDAAPYA